MEPFETPNILTNRRRWNLLFGALAWVCTLCVVTLFVATFNVTFLSISPTSIQHSTLPLGIFFLGIAISYSLSSALFSKQGPTFGFLMGVACSLVGTVLGGVSLMQESPALNVVAALFLGLSSGVGLMLPLIFIELVPTSHATLATALILLGGVVAAVVGPESGYGAGGKFGDDSELHLEYLGVYLMTGIFSMLNGIFVSLMRFNEADQSSSSDSDSAIASDVLSQTRLLLGQRDFVAPLLISTVSSVIMVVPTSTVRVVMDEVEFSARDSLLVIELLFASMFATIFVSRRLNGWVDCRIACGLGIIASLCGLILGFVSREESIAPWIFCMILLGMGWSLCLLSTKAWLAATYLACSKTSRQRNNEILVFFLCGACTVISGYVYDARSSPLLGWRTLCGPMVGLAVICSAVLAIDWRHERRSISGALGTDTPQPLPKDEAAVISEITSILERDRGRDGSSVVGSTTSNAPHDLSLFKPQSFGSSISGVEVADETRDEESGCNNNISHQDVSPPGPIATSSTIASLPAPRQESADMDGQNTGATKSRSLLSEASGEINKGIEVAYGVDETLSSDET